MARLRVIQMRRRHTKISYPLLAHSKRTATISQCTVRRARTNTDRDTGDGRAATGSRGAVDDDDDD